LVGSAPLILLECVGLYLEMPEVYVIIFHSNYMLYGCDESQKVFKEKTKDCLKPSPAFPACAKRFQGL
jgi:hypothetical protein